MAKNKTGLPGLKPAFLSKQNPSRYLILKEIIKSLWISVGHFQHWTFCKTKHWALVRGVRLSRSGVYKRINEHRRKVHNDEIKPKTLVLQEVYCHNSVTTRQYNKVRINRKRGGFYMPNVTDALNKQPQEKSKKIHDNYSSSIYFTFGISVALVILMGLVGCFATAGLDNLPSWFIDLIYGFLIVSQMVSGNGYAHILGDKLFKDKTVFIRISRFFKKQPKIADKSLTNGRDDNTPLLSQTPQEKPKSSKWQTAGLGLGAIIAITITVLFITKTIATDKLTNMPLPFIKGFYHLFGHIAHGSTLEILSYTFSISFLLLGNLSLFCGLGNRIGRFADYCLNHSNNDFFRHKHINYALSIAIGILAGIALTIGAIFAAGGISAFMTFGAIPIGFMLCAVSIVSISASSAGYIGRVFDFVLGKRTIGGLIKEGSCQPKIDEQKEQENALLLKNSPTPQYDTKTLTGRFKKNPLEHGLTLAGVLIGIAVVAILLIVTGGTATALLIPALIALKPIAGSVVAQIITFAAGVSIFGGLGNRVGYALDRGRQFVDGVELETLINKEENGSSKVLLIDNGNHSIKNIYNNGNGIKNIKDNSVVYSPPSPIPGKELSACPPQPSLTPPAETLPTQTTQGSTHQP
jgi:hypothetical protein